MCSVITPHLHTIAPIKQGQGSVETLNVPGLGVVWFSHWDSKKLKNF
jgi:hypothetical protein